MPVDFLPKSEAKLLQWSINFRAVLERSSQAAGVSAQQMEDYTAVQQAYAQAYRLAKNPETRTSPRVRKKDEAKRALQAETRKLARFIRTRSFVTAAQRKELGLSARNPGGARPVAPPPRDKPGLKVVSVTGFTVRVRLHDITTPMRLGKPKGVFGATLFRYVGAEASPPDDLDQWTFVDSTSQTFADVEFTPGEHVYPGAKVWLTAVWINPRGEAGPASEPVSARLQDGIRKSA